MWNGPAATTAAAPPNLARLIAPTLHRSWVVSCLLTKEGGREGGRRRRDIGLNSGWGGGLNGVICREFTLLTVTVILLRCWLTDSWLLLFFISWEDFRIQRGITRDWQRGTSEEFFFFFFFPFPPLYRLLSLWSVIHSSLFITAWKVCFLGSCEFWQRERMRKNAKCA